MKSAIEIEGMIAAAEKELAQLDARRSIILERIKKLRVEKDLVDKIHSQSLDHNDKAPVTTQSSESEKISLFRMLFKGREDVYPRRYSSRRTGKEGYQPACRNEWLKGICKKSQKSNVMSAKIESFFPLLMRSFEIIFRVWTIRIGISMILQ